MKKLYLCVGLFVVGIITTIFLYPFFHELGHIIFAYLICVKIREITFLPLPSVLCEIESQNNTSIILVGIGGLVLPYLISIMVPKKYFWAWYVWLLFSCICIYSLVLSVLSYVFYLCEFTFVCDDIWIIMKYTNNRYDCFVWLFLILIIIRLLQIIKSHPIQRILQYNE